MWLFTIDGREVVAVNNEYANRKTNLPYEGDAAGTPQSLDDVRLYHASCRKPHGQDPDALALLDPTEQLGQMGFGLEGADLLHSPRHQFN